ncbi:retrovirus-related pol polyprotein from transposon TNT 1-94 [Tanacetum coccineum]
MSNSNTNLQTQSSNALHNAIMEAGSKDRPPMLAPGNYVQWKSRIKRYIDTKPNSELIHHCLQNPPYTYQWAEKTVPVAEGSSETTTERYMENYKNVSQDIRDQLNAEAEAVQIILTGIDNDIYSTVNACPNACEMWKTIERLTKGESINAQDLETNLYWEFGKFTPQDSESLESYYSRFYKMMNELSQELKTVSYHKLYDILKQHQNEVNEIRAERLAHQSKLPETAEKQLSTLLLLFMIKNLPRINYKPTNQQPSNFIIHPVELNHDYSLRINRGTGYENQRVVNVAEARENVGTPAVQKSGIQCYNCKEYGHVSRECHKLKRPKDAAYHKEKMLLCKQEEAGIQLNAEQADWKDDTDDEYDDQELEAHYMYMAQIQEVTPDAVENSRLIFDVEPLQKVQNNNDNYNVFAAENEHHEQLESMNDTYLEEQGDTNITIDSLDMCYDREQDDQDDTDELDQEHDLLASLIEKLKCEIDDRKNRNKFLESSNKALVDKLKGCYNDNLALMLAPEYDEMTRLDKESRSKLSDLIRHFDYDQLNNLYDLEYYYADHMNAILGVYTDLDEVTNLQCDYMEALEKCECLEKELSKSKTMSKSFEALQKHAINLELALQQCKEHIKNDKAFKENQSNVFMKERVIPTTSVSRPQLKSNQFKDSVMSNNSQGKKKEVEDHCRNFKFSNNKTFVTACNDSLNAKTSNVNFVCVTYEKRVLNENHDICVLHYINGVNSRTKRPIVMPISTREPMQTVNQSVATPLKRTVASESTNQKPRHITRKLYEQVSKTCSWWYPKFTPSRYKWKPKSPIGNVNTNVSMPLGNASRTANILEPMTPRCSTVSNTPLSSNSFAARAVTFRNDQIAPILGYGDLVQGTITIKRGNDLLKGSRGTDLYSITLQESTTPNPICLMAKATSSQAWLWHRRLSHLNFDAINLLSKNNIVNGLPKLKFVKDHLCSSCELGKAKRKSFHTKTTPSSKRRLQLLHMDLCGPMRVESINGKKYVLVIVDDYSRYTWTHFLRSKDETPGVLIDFLTLVQRGLHAHVTTVRTDKGTEFLNKTLHAYFAKEGIRHETSTTQTPKQNGVVERRNRTLVEAARTMLSAAKVPLFFWAEAIATTCFTQNRSLVIPRHEKTPYHIINARKPSVKFFHIFGSLCYIVRDGENLDKMKEKGDACIFVGYSTQSRAYRVFNKRTRIIVETIHVNFDEFPQMAPMFDKLINGTTPVVSKSSAVHAVDAPDKRQHQNTTHSSTTIVVAAEPSLFIHTTPQTTNQAPTQVTTVTSPENIIQAETNTEYAQVDDDEFINIFSTSVQERGDYALRIMVS